MSESRGEIPKKIDRYEIIEAVGYGAMGAVYKAFDPLIKRPVAVKTLRLDVPPQSPDYKLFLDRFATEARTAGRLSHPNIITLYDVGHTEDQVPWLAMEFVEGQTVAELLEGERLRAEVVVSLVSQIAAAIDHAHSEGVIHRDIKPSNVIVFGGEKVKVTDFGIAKLMDANATHSGLMMGTPSYMSPEQAMGEELDGRTDIFSLGVVAFEMLSGQQPFPGNNVTSILYKLVHSDPVHPDDLEVLGLLPDKWHQVFSRVLAKDPIERFATAAEFVEELEHCLGSWFGSLEGETVIIKGPAALIGNKTVAFDKTVLAPPDDSDSPVKTDEPDETVVVPLPGASVDAGRDDPMQGATTTLERDVVLTDVGTETVTAPLAAGEETVYVPPPESGAEETLYAAADETASSLDAVDETLLDKKTAVVSTARRLRIGQKEKLLLGGGAFAVLLAVLALFVFDGWGGGEDREPAPPVLVATPESPPRLVVDSGSLIITSEPEGATVIVDGEEAGATPIELQLPFSVHELVIEREGFYPEELTASLTADAPNQTLSLALRPEPPEPAFVRIRSEPPGAQVEIDGNFVGPTPTDPLRVSAGNRTVRIVHEGFLPWEDTIRARSGRTVDVDAVLTERHVDAVLTERHASSASPDETPPVPTAPQVEIGTLVRRGEPGVENPECLECPAVRYPESARRQRLEGVVELTFIIDENGVVLDIEVRESGGEVFDEAVTATVSAWRWAPATKYDVPVKIRWVQRFRFRQGR